MTPEVDAAVEQPLRDASANHSSESVSIQNYETKLLSVKRQYRVGTAPPYIQYNQSGWTGTLKRSNAVKGNGAVREYTYGGTVRRCSGSGSCPITSSVLN